MDKVISTVADLDCPAQTAFAMFTENQHLQGWLTALADVEPQVGGKYELFWNPGDKENDSTIGCKVTALQPGKLLCFEWKGTSQLKEIMNEIRPLTHVSVFFLPAGEQTEVHLVHSGWGASAEWEQARSFFEKAWEMAFSALKKYVKSEAVAKCCELTDQMEA